MALPLIPWGMAQAQDGTSPTSEEKTETVAPSTEPSGQDTQAQPDDASTHDSGQETATPPADSPELPEVVVETDDPAGEAADTDAAQTAPQVTGQQTTYVAPQPVPPTSDVIGPVESTVQSVIFGAPVEGSTLNRGTSGVDGYFASGTSVATKTNTPIMRIPGTVTIITKQLAQDLDANLLGEALQYVPGIAVQQGEGHRDQITFRGQETTADFFVDGVRDDIQTFRDLYNAETVEVLKGPLAMIFGRGGGGGVINRVTKKADGIPIYAGTFSNGSYGRARFAADVGQAVTPDYAFRLNAMYENSATFRDFSYLERYGINPTAGFKLGPKTTLHMSYEYKVHDQNVDRGGTSLGSRPFKYPIETFWGQPLVSFTEFDGHVATATLQHEFDSGLSMRNHTFYGKYDKLYQNIMPGSQVGQFVAGTVRYGEDGGGDDGGYQSFTDRQNIVNQTDFAYSFHSHPHVRHTVLAGAEVVVQDNAEQRFEPVFIDGGMPVFFIDQPVSNPTIFNETSFPDPSRNRHTDVTTLSAYIQDQVEITPYFELIGGIRFEHFDVDFDDVLNGTKTSRIDNVWSPRIGGVIKPWEHFHWYLSYARSFLPQNGDNFGSLSPSAATLAPEEFENYETGFKWVLQPRLLLTGAIYQLNRQNQRLNIGGDNVAIGETRTRGAEIEINGYITDQWQVFGGYAYTDALILKGGTDFANNGNTVESAPLNMFSMWNKYQFNYHWGVGLGVIAQSSWFAESNNAVKIPGYGRVDGAIYYDHDETWSAQLNVVNLFDTEYWISSHNNENISYGAPLSAYITLRAGY